MNLFYSPGKDWAWHNTQHLLATGNIMYKMITTTCTYIQQNIQTYTLNLCLKSRSTPVIIVQSDSCKCKNNQYMQYMSNNISPLWVLWCHPWSCSHTSSCPCGSSPHEGNVACILSYTGHWKLSQQPWSERKTKGKASISRVCIIEAIKTSLKDTLLSINYML